MTNWREVERVRLEHPDWGSESIAAELGCLGAYVRATAQRRGWILPPQRDTRFAYAKLGIEHVLPLCHDGESPSNCLQRIVDAAVHKQLARRRSRAA